MKHVALILTGALFALNTQVFAADAPSQAAPRSPKMLQQFDTDKDGKISRDEFAAKRAKGFARFDTNKDGSLSLEEFKASCKNERCTQSKTKQFAKLDKNSDSAVTKDEFARMTAMFDKLDVNKDGYLSDDELPKRKPNNRMNKGDRADKTAPADGMHEGMRDDKKHGIPKSPDPVPMDGAKEQPAKTM